jgi:hypothetical protein
LIGLSSEGSTVCVLIRRLNSLCSRSIAFEVRIEFHWLIGKPMFPSTRSLVEELDLLVGITASDAA